MKNAMRRVFAMLLAAVLLATFLPDSMAGAVAAYAEQIVERRAAQAREAVPVREITPAQAENAAAVAALLADAGAEAQEGEFFYRPLGDGTVAVTGYGGGAEQVALPRTLGGGDVVAIGSGAFGPEVRAVEIHGNALYIADDALARGAAVSAWQGSYAAAWAQARGCALSSLTEGVLYANVADMTDALDRMRVLSDSMISVGATEARRLNAGDLFILNRGEGDESFYRVTGKRAIGARTYLTVRPVDITEIYSYRLYEGEKSVTKTFTDVQEEGVDVSDGDIAAASEVLEHAPTSQVHTHPSQNLPIKLPNSREINISYKQVTTVTSSYRVVVEGGKVIEGTMAKQQEDVRTVEVKYKEKGKICSIDGGVGGKDMTAEQLAAVEQVLRWAKGKEPGKKLGSYTFIVVPAIGLGFELNASVGWEFGGSGKVSWTSRSLDLYDYVPSKGEWGFRESKGLNNPDPEVTGAVYGKVSASAGINLIVGYVTSELHTKAEASIGFNLSIPSDPDRCIGFSVNFTGTISVEGGLWFHLGGWEIQAASVGSIKITLWDIKLVDLHYSKNQGIHPASRCAYTPMDYCLRFVTGTSWQPDSICYLKKGTYSYHPVTAEVLSFEAESVFGNVDKVSVVEPNHISFDYGKNPTALDDKITLPQQNRDEKNAARWRIMEPATVGDYEWDDNLTVKQNLETAYGKAITSEKDLPKAVTLVAEWSNKFSITYDANGGKFDANTGVGTLLTKYYAPGEICQLPCEQPTKDLALFKCWTEDIEGKKEWKGGTAITKNMRVYAQYENFDPTDHSTINSRFGATPTLIGDASVRDQDPVNWELKFNGWQTNPSELSRILQNGVDAFEASDDWTQFCELFGGGITCTPVLRNFKGRAVGVDGKAAAFALTGLVDETLAYGTFVVPSTINGLPVVMEKSVMQKLRASTVVFAPTPDASVPGISLTQSDDSLFMNNLYVEHVYMDKTGIINLGDKAFSGCANLEGVSLPGTLQQIGTEAFRGCGKLTKAEFGLQVDTIKKDAFHGCTALVDVSVSTPYLTSMSEAFRDDDGVPAHIDLKLEKMVHVLPGHAFNRCKSIKSLTVAEKGLLREIGDCAFCNCSNLSSAKLSEGLQSIRQAAFSGTALEEIVIPATVTDYYHSAGYTSDIFYGTPLKKITIGGAITSIERYMFTNANNYASTVEEIVLRKGVTEIGESGMYGCTALKKVWLPKTLTTIGDSAFSGCEQLKRVGVDPDNQAADLVLPEGVTTLGEFAFSSCTALTSVVTPKTLTGIAESAFSNCSSLSSVKLGEGLQSIGPTAFKSTALTEIVIPSTVTDYYYSANYASDIFYSTPLKKITIGGAITSIERFMFTNANNYASTVEEIVLREGVTEIGQSGMLDCNALKKVRLPKTLKTIGDSVFYSCEQLQRVGVDPDNQAADLVLPEGMMTLGNHAFYQCKALKSVVTPKTLVRIGNSAFYGCSSLSSAKLGEGLQSIGSAAFSGTALTEIVIPATVTDYYYNASFSSNIFYSTPLKKITIGGAITSIKRHMFTNANNYASTVEEIVLREGVTEIGELGMYDCNALKKVRLPKTLKTIGDSAFSSCEQLQRVGMNPDNQAADLVLPYGVTTLGDHAFDRCNLLGSVVTPKTLLRIGNSAFYGCSSLSSAKLGEGLQSIGSAAFSGTALTEIVIPATVTDYYYNASFSSNIFYSAPLKKITIGGAITRIERFMFTNANNYTSTVEEIVLREGVTEIGESGMYGCRALKKVWLPKTLTTIGSQAFYNDTQLECVYAGPNLNAIGSNAFSNAHPTFYAIPGTERNAWLADWCQANGFTYNPDHVYKVSVTFSLGSLAGKIEGEGVQGSSATEVDALGLLEEPETPACEGWRFLGWFAPDSEEPWDFAHDRVGTDDLVLTARWQREGANGLYRIENGEATLVSYALAEGDDTDVALPPAWKGYPVTAIEDGAFAGEGLTSLTLPAQVSGVTAATFEGADSLAWIFTTSDCLNYRARNGILYSADMTELVCCPASWNLETLALPEGVTAIGAGALRGQETLEEIEFNSALERIGDGAFEGCDRLSELALPDSLRRIGAAAFRGCDGLRRVGGGANLQTIGDNAFALTGFCIFYGEEASALARYAQANERLYNLYDVTYQLDGESVATRRVKSGEAVPEVVAAAPEGRVVGGGWYADAAMETEWDFDADRMPLSDLTLYAATLPMFVTQDYTPEGEGAQVGARVTGYNGTETEITIPDEIDCKAVYVVDAAAFPNGCALTLPGGLLEIDAAAFAQANITLYAPAGSATEQLLLDAGCALNRPMRTLAFEVNGGAQVSAIRAQAGSEIALPGAVRDGGELIGWYADADLTSRVGGAGESYTVPEDGATLYAGWSGDAPDYDFLWKQEGEEIVVTGGRGRKAVEVPATVNGLPVTRIADSAFDSDAALEEIDLPEGLLAIGSYAFRGSDLNGIALPATVTSIGRYAFSGCRWLLRCEWPAATTEMQEGMFSGDAALQSLELPEGLRKIDARALEQCEMLKTLALPDSVTGVGSEAFRDMKGLRTLMIGSGLAGLGSDALDGCAALSAIEVSQNNENYVSVDGVLYYADQAGLVKYPAGKAGESYAVSENAMLIEAHAFAGAALEEIALPDGIAQIGEGAFANSGLTGIDLSGLSALAQLPEGAFEDCRALEAVNLPDGLTGIGGGAFDGCGALAELDVPDAVTAIGGDAFSAYSELICGADTAALDYALAYGLAYRLRGAAIVPAQEIACDRDSLTLMAGLPFHLTATVSPADATDALEWASSDTEVLRVDGGYIRPLKPGEAEITARAGEAERTIPVRVVGCALEIEQASCWLYTDGALRLTLRNIADNYEMTGATWACEGGAVTQNGTLSADATGIVTVSASAPEGGTIARQFAFIARDQAMILPAAVKRIDDEAFRGMSGMTCAVIPDGATTIGAYAFADCGALGLVRIPESVTAIDDTAFDNSPNVILICGADSAAGAFAERNGMRALLVP